MPERLAGYLTSCEVKKRSAVYNFTSTLVELHKIKNVSTEMQW